MATLQQLRVYLDPRQTPISPQTMPVDVWMRGDLEGMLPRERGTLIRDYGAERLVSDWLRRSDAMSGDGHRGGTTPEEHSARFGIGFLRWLAGQHPDLLRAPVQQALLTRTGITSTHQANWVSCFLRYYSSENPPGLRQVVTWSTERGQARAPVAPLARWLLLRWTSLSSLSHALQTAGWNPNQTTSSSDYIDSMRRPTDQAGELAGARYFAEIFTRYRVNLQSLSDDFERFIHGVLGLGQLNTFKQKLNAWGTLNNHMVTPPAGIPSLPGFPPIGLPYPQPAGYHSRLPVQSVRITAMVGAVDYAVKPLVGSPRLLPVPSRGNSGDSRFQGYLDLVGVIMNRFGEGQPPRVAPWF